MCKFWSAMKYEKLLKYIGKRVVMNKCLCKSIWEYRCFQCTYIIIYIICIILNNINKNNNNTNIYNFMYCVEED